MPLGVKERGADGKLAQELLADEYPPGYPWRSGGRRDIWGTEGELMNHEDVARQTQVEQELLGHIMQVVRISAGWPVPGPDASRKLSTLRFVAQSFQRHLEHLLTLEEYDGYMDLVRTLAPRLGRTTDVLKTEHDVFRGETRHLVQRLERLPASDIAGLDRICTDMLGLLNRVEEHNAKETALIQDAMAQDEGGEG
jgi:hypothetical protein